RAVHGREPPDPPASRLRDRLLEVGEQRRLAAQQRGRRGGPRGGRPASLRAKPAGALQGRGSAGAGTPLIGASRDDTVEVVRGALVESRHRVHAAVVDANGQIRAAAGDPDLVTYIRSAAKPFQAIPLVADGALD